MRVTTWQDEQATFKPSTFNLQPSTFNLQPSTFNLQPSTFNLQPSNLQLNTEDYLCLGSVLTIGNLMSYVPSALSETSRDLPLVPS
jgi:hypothetical protein